MAADSIVKFQLGQIVATPNALAAINSEDIAAAMLVYRESISAAKPSAD